MAFNFLRKKTKSYPLKNSSNKAKIGIMSPWYHKGLSYLSRFLAQCLNEKFNVYIYAHDRFTEDEGDKHYKKLIFDKDKHPNPKNVLRWIKKRNLN